MIYLDNAATTMWKPPQVITYMQNAMGQMANAGRGTHESACTAARLIYETREELCKLFRGADPRRTVFTMNATMALNMALKGLDLQAGDEVVTTLMEHNSVLRPLYELEKNGVVLRFADCDEEGRLRIDDLSRLITGRTRAVVCTHASNVTGNVNDLHRIGEISRAHNVKFIVDASQSAGILPIDMQADHIDVLCFTGHKGLCGPQGTGGMVIGPDVRLRPLLSGGTGAQSFSHTQPVRLPDLLEAGTQNGHGIAGLRGALDYLDREGREKLYKKEDRLARMFYKEVSGMDGIRLYGAYEDSARSPIVTLNIGEFDSAQVCDELGTQYGVSVRGGAHCAPLMHRFFHTEEQGAVRFSFSHSNTEDEVAYAVWALRKIIGS